MEVHEWSLSEVSAHADELIDKAKRSPQFISHRGVCAAVLVSLEEYKSIKDEHVNVALSKAQKQKKWVEFIRNSSRVGVDLDIKRDKSDRSHLREVDFGD